MIFVQKYTVNEYIFGRQSFRFAVSDNYEDLFKQDNEITITETSIFQLESVKQDLELDDGSFAIDEMKFSINSASCLTADDTNALYFLS